MAANRPAQILVFTVLILLVISLAVISITTTVARNSKQVFSNLEYEKSYNYAEAETISAINALSNPNYDLTDLSADGLGDLECTAAGSKFICSRDLDEGTRRVVLSITETNVVENYDLAAGDYFDVILGTGGSNFYTGNVEFRWVGETAFDISLVYLDASNNLKTAHQIIDSAGVYTSSGAGFFSPAPTISQNSLLLNLQQVNKSLVPNGSKYKYLRIKSVSRDFGTSITIRPQGGGNFPQQVRRVEAFSYNIETAASPAPVVLTQLPLSPQVPSNLTLGVNANAFKAPICGNNVVEGPENCDDGGAGGCPANCRGCGGPMPSVLDSSTCKVAVVSDPAYNIHITYLYNNLTTMGRANTNYSLFNSMAQFIGQTTAAKDNFDVIIMQTFAGIPFQYVTELQNRAESGKQHLVINTDHNEYIAGTNQILSKYGVQAVGNDGLLGPLIIKETQKTRTGFRGLTQSYSTTASTLVVSDPSKDGQVCCQYTNSAGNGCYWAEVGTGKPGMIQVFSSGGSLGGNNSTPAPYNAAATQQATLRKLLDGLCN
jgi:hypothetical protein